jgi:hypothetical protein
LVLEAVITSHLWTDRRRFIIIVVVVIWILPLCETDECDYGYIIGYISQLQVDCWGSPPWQFLSVEWPPLAFLFSLVQSILIKESDAVDSCLVPQVLCTFAVHQ